MCKIRDMCLTGFGKKSFRPIGYFQAEIKIHDSKFGTSIFVIHDIHQGTLTVSNNDVKTLK